MPEVIIILLLAAAIGTAAYLTAKKLRKGGGCCGEHEKVERTAVQDKNKSHYPYKAELQISGMTCENCARRVENALNVLDGVWARVDLGSHTAHILLKQEPDVPLLCRTVAKAGYAAAARSTRTAMQV